MDKRKVANRTICCGDSYRLQNNLMSYLAQTSVVDQLDGDFFLTTQQGKNLMLPVVNFVSSGERKRKRQVVEGQLVG